MILANKCLLAFFLYLVAQPAMALDLKELNSQASQLKVLNLKKVQNNKKLKKLSLIKWHSHRSHWNQCLELSESVYQNKSLGVWLAVNHLNCLKNSYSSKNKWKTSRYLDSFKKIEFNKDALLLSPIKAHGLLLVETFLDLAHLASEKARGRFEAFINRNSDLVDLMSEEQRARYYKVMGEYAWLRQKNDLARVNFLRSYSFKEDKTVLKRLVSLKGHNSLDINKYTKQSKLADKEQKLWDQYLLAKKKGKTYLTAQYGVEFLNEIPSSIYTSEVIEKVGRLYKRLLYRKGSQYRSIKNDFEKELLKAPPQAIFIWAKMAFDRGYHQSSFIMANEASKKWQGQPQAAPALLLAARSAYYIQKHSDAKKHFLNLIEQYSGHEESNEARYLLGLLHYRLSEYQSVVSLYDQFLMKRGSDKWELQVRYWLWRSLLKLKSERAQPIADSILKQFPLTYYGLIVRMKVDAGIQSVVSQNNIQSQISLWQNKRTSQRWQRINNLAQWGWLDEAATEVDLMPEPQTAPGHHLRALLWLELIKPNRAIKDFADAIDKDPQYITQNILQLSFPQSYKEIVTKAAKEFSIDQEFIWALMRQESAFVEDAVSPSKAYGLMQMLKNTAGETARWLRVKSYRPSRDIFKPEINIRFGTHFFSRMVRKYKKVIPLAIASYNVGPGNLDRWLKHRKDMSNWPEIGENPDDDIWVDELPWAETSFYVKAVMRNFLLYKVIYEEYDQMVYPPWKE